MSVTWDATGKLRPLWGRVGGRDKLAAATGIVPTLLSSYNSGKRRLPLRHAELIAQQLGVTLVDLGAPLGVDEVHVLLRDEIRELAKKALLDLLQEDAEVREAVRRLARSPIRDLLEREEFEPASDGLRP